MGLNRFRRAIGSLLAAGAITAVIPLTMGASASTHVPSGNKMTGNWAGYYAVPANGKGPEAVFTQFTVPRARCYNVIGRYPAYVSMWAGIGGAVAPNMNDIQNGKQAWLEQAGLQITCKSKSSAPVYEPFAETVAPTDNAEPNIIMHNDTEGKPRTIQPGDHIFVGVYDNSSGRTKKFGMAVNVNRDSEDGYTFFKQMYVPSSAYTGRTAEVVTEYPIGGTKGPFQNALDKFTQYELGTTSKPNSTGVIVVGSVRYSSSGYLTHLKGDVKPRGVAATQYKMSLSADPTAFSSVKIYSSVAFPTIPGNPGYKDGFFTYYR